MKTLRAGLFKETNERKRLRESIHEREHVHVHPGVLKARCLEVEKNKAYILFFEAPGLLLPAINLSESFQSSGAHLKSPLVTFSTKTML